MALTVQNVNGTLTFFQDGTEVTRAEARALLAATPEGTAAVNEKTLLDKIGTALTNNATYLAIASPSAAQNTAQVKALTRQVNALMRLAGRQLDNVTGT